MILRDRRAARTLFPAITKCDKFRWNQPLELIAPSIEGGNQSFFKGYSKQIKAGLKAHRVAELETLCKST